MSTKQTLLLYSIDVETTGTIPNIWVAENNLASIGITPIFIFSNYYLDVCKSQFDWDFDFRLAKILHTRLRLTGCPDVDTMKWWDEQSDRAREYTFATRAQVDIPSTLRRLRAFDYRTRKLYEAWAKEKGVEVSPFKPDAKHIFAPDTLFLADPPVFDGSFLRALLTAGGFPSRHRILDLRLFRALITGKPYALANRPPDSTFLDSQAAISAYEALRSSKSSPRAPHCADYDSFVQAFEFCKLFENAPSTGWPSPAFTFGELLFGTRG